jgi:hypothetical protein
MLPNDWWSEAGGRTKKGMQQTFYSAFYNPRHFLKYVFDSVHGNFFYLGCRPKLIAIYKPKRRAALQKFDLTGVIKQQHCKGISKIKQRRAAQNK